MVHTTGRFAASSMRRAYLLHLPTRETGPILLFEGSSPSWLPDQGGNTRLQGLSSLTNTVGLIIRCRRHGVIFWRSKRLPLLKNYCGISSGQTTRPSMCYQLSVFSLWSSCNQGYGVRGIVLKPSTYTALRASSMINRLFLNGCCDSGQRTEKYKRMLTAWRSHAVFWPLF